MRIRDIWVGSLTCLVGLVLCQAAIAQVTDKNIVVGTRAVTSTGLFQNATTPFRVRVGFSAYRSYCCTVRGDNERAEINSFADSFGFGNSFPFEYRGGVSPAISDEAGSVTRGRACLLRESGGFADIIVQSTTSPIANLEVACEETSLRGGYNTNATELNFLEITNYSGVSTRVRVVAFSEPEGQQLFDSTLEIPGGDIGAPKRVDIDIHSVVGPNRFGPLLVLHDLPKGALSATLTRYDITSTNPLDFVPRATIKFD